MPYTYVGEWVVDEAALTAYLRSRGLTPQMGKWKTVWCRKRYKFGHYK